MNLRIITLSELMYDNFCYGGNRMYARIFKRIIDFVLSLCALTVLFPVLLVLTVVGAIAMGGNPFFVQSRPGK